MLKVKPETKKDLIQFLDSLDRLFSAVPYDLSSMGIDIAKIGVLKKVVNGAPEPDPKPQKVDGTQPVGGHRGTAVATFDDDDDPDEMAVEVRYDDL